MLRFRICAVIISLVVIFGICAVGFSVAGETVMSIGIQN
jgi:hypothetical protein